MFSKKVVPYSLQVIFQHLTNEIHISPLFLNIRKEEKRNRSQILRNEKVITKKKKTETIFNVQQDSNYLC